MRAHWKNESLKENFRRLLMFCLVLMVEVGEGGQIVNPWPFLLNFVT